MTYATEIVQNYRLALRDLWNNHFWLSEPYRDSARVPEFKALKLPLFVSLVAMRLGPDLKPPKELFGSAYLVVPPAKVRGYGSIPLMQVERKDRPGIWEVVQGPFTGDGLKLVLLDFFDWAVEDWRDFRYFLVRIELFEQHAELVGCNALVDVLTADVLWDPPEILGLPHRR